MAAVSRAAPAALVKMADLARLSGVPAPTIKHYIREGLLPAPERRTSRNMAYYDARLAERVRAIKDLQARFLPPGIELECANRQATLAIGRIARSRALCAT